MGRVRKVIKNTDGSKSLLCSKCNQIKSINDFSPDDRRFTGRQSHCKECVKNYQSLNRTKEQVRAINLKHFYGIEQVEYDILYVKQNGRCLICNEFKETLVIDHCHKTNIIRGLLCRNCNIGIGNLQDNIEILKSAINYLERYLNGNTSN